MPLTKVNKEFQSAISKRALKSYIVPVIVKHYQVIAVRALLDKDESDRSIWGKRRRMESLLNTENSIGGFFSCITGLEDHSSEDEEKTIYPGVCFWVFFDWPEHGLSSFETRLTKLFLESGLSINKCSIIKSRGKLFQLIKT